MTVAITASAGSERFEAGPDVAKQSDAQALNESTFYRSEFTAAGEQMIIPGCEMDAPQAKAKQMDLF